MVPRFAHGSRVPGWDESVDLTKAPAVIPDPATTPVPEALRSEIRRRWPSTPTGARPRSPPCTPPRPCTATARRRRSQVAAVMQLTPAYLTSVATFYDMLEPSPAAPPRRLRVHQHLVLAARRRRALRRDGRAPPAAPRTSTCARSSAWVPATSRRWRRSTASTWVRWRTPTPRRSSRTCAPAARCSSKQIRYRQSVGPRGRARAGEFGAPSPTSPARTPPGSRPRMTAGDRPTRPPPIGRGQSRRRRRSC